jgi:hypothetical protein
VEFVLSIIISAAIKPSINAALVPISPTNKKGIILLVISLVTYLLILFKVCYTLLSRPSLPHNNVFSKK